MRSSAPTTAPGVSRVVEPSWERTRCAPAATTASPASDRVALPARSEPPRRQITASPTGDERERERRPVGQPDAAEHEAQRDEQRDERDPAAPVHVEERRPVEHDSGTAREREHREHEPDERRVDAELPARFPRRTPATTRSSSLRRSCGRAIKVIVGRA